jgi:hypothetical protein
VDGVGQVGKHGLDLSPGVGDAVGVRYVGDLVRLRVGTRKVATLPVHITIEKFLFTVFLLCSVGRGRRSPPFSRS